MSLRTIIVGCGAVAQRLYRKPLQQLEKRGLVEVVALVDPAVDHARTLQAFFPRARRYDDLETALAASRAELTLILSPAHLHCTQAILALANGSHVLCEKPMASTDEACRRMNAAAAASKRILAIGMIRRFFPAYTQFRQAVDDGRLGALVSFEYREGHKFEWDVTTPAAFRPRRDGGTGVLFDIGPHVADYLAWTFGDLEPVAYADDALQGIESNLSMDLDASGCPGSIHLSWDLPQANELRVVGSRGEAVLRVDRFDQLAVNLSSGFNPEPISVSYPGDAQEAPALRISPRSYTEAIYCQIVQVVRAITLGEAPAVDGEAGRRCVSLLESALSMASPLSAPWLEFAHQSASRKLHWTHSA